MARMHARRKGKSGSKRPIWRVQPNWIPYEVNEIEDLVNKHVKQQFYKSEYEKIFDGDEFWRKLQVVESTTFDWDKNSTYIKKPPYFDGFNLQPVPSSNIWEAKTLLLMGDSITTDHI